MTEAKPEPDLSKYSIAICTPAYGGMMHASYVSSLALLMHKATKHGLHLTLHLVGQHSLITFARNHLVSTFLGRADATHLLWIDADVGFSWEGVKRLLLADLDFVGGLYPRKAFPLTYVCNPFIQHLKPDLNGLAEVRHLPTGFTLVKRRVFEKMIAAYPEMKRKVYDEGRPEVQKLNDNLYGFYDTGVSAVDGFDQTEDYAFCERWSAIGGRIFADTQITLTHTGPHQFGGFSPAEVLQHL